jgi:hypothetical protein
VTVIILRMNSYYNLLSRVRLLEATGGDFWELIVKLMKDVDS